MQVYPDYKPSGIDWIGDIPSHWEVKKLKYVGSLQSGDSITSDAIKETGEFPVYGGNGLRGYTSTFTHEGVFVLIGRQGALCGNINYANGKFWASEHAVVVTILGKANHYWLGELLRTMNLNQYSVSAAQPGLAIERIQPLPIPLPPLSEQTTIARYLDEKTTQLDTLIARKRRLIDLLREEKAALINEAVTKGINPGVPMKDSGIEWLGEVPAHWEVKKLKYVVTKVGSGVTPSGGAAVYKTEGIPLLRSQNIHFDGLRLDDVAYIEESVDESMKNSRTQHGDVLLNITGASIGRCYFVPEDLERGNVNQHVCIVRPRFSTITTHFLYLLLRSSIGQTQIDLLQTGANREGLNFEQLKNFTLTLPDLSEQTEIVSFLNAETAKIDYTLSRIEREIELMQEYRTALISEVVTGKVCVV